MKGSVSSSAKRWTTGVHVISNSVTGTNLFEGLWSTIDLVVHGPDAIGTSFDEMMRGLALEVHTHHVLGQTSHTLAHSKESVARIVGGEDGCV